MPSADSPEREPEKPQAPLSPAEKRVQSVSSQVALAMELPFVFVATIVVGGGLGWLLDRWLHTRPIFLLVLGAVGFVGGLREILRRLDR